MTVAREDPYTNFNFLVSLEGEEVGGFSEAELPESRIEAIAYREGAERHGAVRLLPGRVQHGPLVLRRGFAGDLRLWQWFERVAAGTLDRRTVVVTLLDESREPVNAWRLERAWPTRYAPGPLNARGNEVLIEELELVHEGITVE